ncbi:4Fe-4S binding protein [uncultured Adlercreutzia sp.]|uniref:4Fe-4S binding protein n=1 Tax=uncultured Adlercreutzia sp. TaxID=875803 RepID=UPI00267653A2|nr:4Fe-4S binding protein [uncultured Adlercreutzia sp.]
MTNYRHAQMIHLIGAMDSPLLAVEPGRCLLVRHRNADCLRCAEVCTTGAISLGEEGVVVSAERCIGCGTCASACPSGCLSAANPTDEELFSAVEKALAAHGEKVALICETAWKQARGRTGGGDDFAPGKPLGTLEDGRAAIGVVCLGRADESLLVEATARGAQSVQLISGPCTSCPHARGGALCDEIVASAENLLAALGAKSPVERTTWTEAMTLTPTTEEPRGAVGCSDRASSAATAAEAESRGVSGGAHQASSATTEEPRGAVGCSDRASSAANETAQWAVSPSEDCPSESECPAAPTGNEPRPRLDPSVRTALIPGANKDFTPEFPHVQPDGTLPHFVPERRLRLFNSLKALGKPARPTVTTRLWGQVDIDTELCRSCRMCTVFCPTGAVSRFDAEGDAFGVEHRSALCMQCRLCETICPEQAITVADTVDVAEFLGGRKFRFTMQPIGWNPGAEDAIASRMARFIKVDNVQEPQAKVKSNDTAERRAYAEAREARRREIRGA